MEQHHQEKLKNSYRIPPHFILRASFCETANVCPNVFSKPSCKGSKIKTIFQDG